MSTETRDDFFRAMLIEGLAHVLSAARRDGKAQTVTAFETLQRELREDPAGEAKWIEVTRKKVRNYLLFERGWRWFDLGKRLELDHLCRNKGVDAPEVFAFIRAKLRGSARQRAVEQVFEP